eukprot:364599-Chlamydomonas_euryale.AAC.24
MSTRHEYQFGHSLTCKSGCARSLLQAALWECLAPGGGCMTAGSAALRRCTARPSVAGGSAGVLFQPRHTHARRKLSESGV